MGFGVAVGRGATFRCGGERDVFPMRRENDLLASAAGTARPRISSRIGCLVGADGIELDIGHLEQPTLRLVLPDGNTAMTEIIPDEPSASCLCFDG